MVWPALLPPWKRTTRSARSASRLVTFPFPSSPHWVPTMTIPGITGEDYGGAGRRPGAEPSRSLEAMAPNAAELLVRCLDSEGVRHVFGVPGEETLDLNAALEDSPIE